MSSDRFGSFRIPVPDWIRDYQKEWIRWDVLAGLTAAAVVIPKAMAYATIAGLPVQVGLYTAFLPMVIYALLGTSRPLSVSTTTTLAILAAAALGETVPDGDSGVPADCFGDADIAGRSRPCAGCAAAPGLCGQLHLRTGPDRIQGRASGSSSCWIRSRSCWAFIFRRVRSSTMSWPSFRGLPDASVATVAVGAVMVGILLAIEHWFPRAPAPLIAVAAGSPAVSLLGLQAYGVRTVGQVPTGLPSLTPPDFSLIVELWPAAVGIALMSFTETIAAGRAFARSGEPTPQPNRELLATGLANAGGALLGAMPAGGGTTQTAVNRLAGARTPGWRNSSRPPARS